MKREIGANRLQKTKITYRFLAIFLCILMVFSICGVVPFSWAKPLDSTEVENTVPEETQEDLKASLMDRIRYEDWDPYSSDMTLDEFYALMELFEDGSLPLKSKEPAKAPSNSPIIGVPGMDEPGIEEPGTVTPLDAQEEVYIPRSLFMFSGLANYEGELPPLEYNNDTGALDEIDNYPAGLDQYSMGYKRPPKEWSGVLTADENKAVVIVPHKNDDDPTINGDVDQELFIHYDGYYVRRVTVQNSEATVLGAIKLQGQNEFVYYYLTNDSQNTDVSTTTLPKDQKFIVQYNVNEHHMYYEVRMDTPDGVDVTDEYADAIFGADRSTGTTDGYYSFVATAPYGYEMQIFRLVEGNTEAEEITGPESATGIIHNEGYPLGREPVYDQYPGTGFRLNTNPNAPSTLMMSDTFYNANVDADRTIIAVLTEKEKPQFNAGNIVTSSDGAKGRGSSAKRFVTATDRITKVKGEIPYDYEDEYLWRKYDMAGSSKYIDYSVANAIGNITTGDEWNWKKDEITVSTMDENDDGTYSYQWTFQTNNKDGGYLMDILEINGVPIRLPFLPKYTERNDDKTGTDKSGISSWFTETTLPHGINVKVEHLMSFNDSTEQHVYRITVTNARSNVTVTGMNLMMYNTGAAEIATYDLSGIYADHENGTVDTSQAAVQFYDQPNKNNNYKVDGWYREAVANVHVDSINYNNGDMKNHGANVRFKLADGYDSPYYLLESSRDGIIPDKDNKAQASTSRDTDGNINFDKQNEIKLMSELKEDEFLDSQYIYAGSDGWYYIRLSEQSPYKMALLTIGAREVKYVVRYLDTYPEKRESDTVLTWEKIGDDEDILRLSNGTSVGIVKNVENIPEFEHIDGKCHPSFHKESDNDIPGQHYDDKNGDYYDTMQDTVALVPLDSKSIPTDPDGGYVFADWVLVDENYEVIKVNDNEFHYLGNPITIAEVNEYAIKNDDLGGSSVDVYVLRLMPTWKKIDNPFSYKVALNWVDTQGELHEEFFSDLWRDVITDWEIENGGLTVKVLKEATPFLDWIAQHPTYTFWDGVNNNNALYRYYSEYIKDMDREEALEKAREEMKKEMAKSIADYLPFLVVDGNITNPEQYNKVLDALCRRDITGAGADGNNGNDQDDFWRLGEYAFQVLENEGTIVIWMYENKGGLVFHKDVQAEPFTADDEFYFTVTDIMVGEKNDTPLNGTYKAYPEKVYDSNGKERKILDKDAWVVTVKNGEITKIVKNDGSPEPNPPVTYFTLKDGEGIMLYAAPGKYTIAELGSKSGGSYKVNVTYTATDGSILPEDSWDIPKEDADLWLRGSSKQYLGNGNTSKDISQIYATVDFDIGERDVVQTLTFCNQTCALSVEVSVKGQDGVTIPSDYLTRDYIFNIAMNLPKNYTPLVDENGNYYFNMVIYNADGTKVRDTIITMDRVDQDTNDLPEGMTWFGQIKLKDGQRAAIVMNVPDQKEMINYWAGEIKDWVDTDTSKLTPQYITAQSGTVKSAECAEIEVVNWYGNLPPNGYLVITETGGKPNESFLYKITDSKGNELIVSVKGGGQTVVCAPLEAYTIEEISDWSWKYEDGICDQSTDRPKGKKATVGISSVNNTPENAVHADYNHARNGKLWLGGENNKNNHFGDPSTSDEEQKSNSSSQEVALLSIFDDKKKKTQRQ